VEKEVSLLEGTLLGELSELVEESVSDYFKAKKGNKSAATRVRKKMLRVRDLYKEIREELRSAKNSDA